MQNEMKGMEGERCVQVGRAVVLFTLNLGATLGFKCRGFPASF